MVTYEEWNRRENIRAPDGIVSDDDDDDDDGEPKTFHEPRGDGRPRLTPHCRTPTPGSTCFGQAEFADPHGASAVDLPPPASALNAANSRNRNVDDSVQKRCKC